MVLKCCLYCACPHYSFSFVSHSSARSKWSFGIRSCISHSYFRVALHCLLRTNVNSSRKGKGSISLEFVKRPCRYISTEFKMPLARDLLHPSPEEERRKHKLKRLVQHPNSYFMDVKCPGCYKITTVFSHAQSVVICAGCSTVLCQPTGGRARLTEGCSFRKKQH